MIRRLINISLRALPLGAKMILTLYMGKYLGLAEIGVYGIVFGAVAILIWVIGLGLGYIVTREIVGAPPNIVMLRIRDQAILSAVTGLLLSIVAIFLKVGHYLNDSGEVVFFSILIGSGEAICNQMYNNMTSNGYPVRASIFLCFRSAGWVFPAIAIGLLSERFRNAETILIFWALFVYGSLFANILLWPGLPLRMALRHKINWTWIWGGVKGSMSLWIASISISFATYIDRFVVDKFLGIEAVGVLSFYYSFSNALYSLMQSGVFSFAVPRLIALHKSGEEAGFDGEVVSMWREVFWLGGGAVVAIGGGVWLILPYFSRPQLSSALPTFFLMLVGSWMRVGADAVYSVLFARNQDMAICVGNFLFLLPVLVLNFLFVPTIGLSGIAYSTIIATGFLMIWRFRAVKGEVVSSS